MDFRKLFAAAILGVMFCGACVREDCGDSRSSIVRDKPAPVPADLVHPPLEIRQEVKHFVSLDDPFEVRGEIWQASLRCSGVLVMTQFSITPDGPFLPGRNGVHEIICDGDSGGCEVIALTPDAGPVAGVRVKPWGGDFPENVCVLTYGVAKR